MENKASVKMTLFDRTFVDTIEPFREHLVIAKEVTFHSEYMGVEQCKTKYLLKTVANRLINPNDFTVYELKKNDSRFVEVSKDVFETYQLVINQKSVVPFRSLEMRVNNA